jgi:uncharacterized protein involved in exopolysaccharide biosynthesis
LTAEQDAMRVLRRNLSVSRVGLSSVIKINFTDSDPQQAARIANAVAAHTSKIGSIPRLRPRRPQPIGWKLAS